MKQLRRHDGDHCCGDREGVHEMGILVGLVGLVGSATLPAWLNERELLPLRQGQYVRLWNF